MVTAKLFTILALAAAIFTEPAAGNRARSSDDGYELAGHGGAANASISPFDGVWEQGGAFVTVSGDKFTTADGARVQAQVKGLTVTVTYPSGQVYGGELSPDGDILIWSDGDVWVRNKQAASNTPTPPINQPYFQPGGGQQPKPPGPDPHAGHHNGAGHAGQGPQGPQGGGYFAGDDPRAKFQPVNPRMRLGRKGEALIPELVPPPGFVYEFENKEKPSAAAMFVEALDSNNYQWKIKGIDRVSDGMHYKLWAGMFATLYGKWQSNVVGHKSVHVRNKAGDEIFTIRSSTHTMNPFHFRWSFRILPPGSKSKDDTRFTINRDYWGAGFLWQREEWRVYRGRKRYDKMVYYCIGRSVGWDVKCYRDEADYKYGSKTVLAEVEKKANGGAILEHGAIPDIFKLKVYPGQDSALLLAASTVIHVTRGSRGRGFLD